jgi:hypothetical protein
MAKARSRGGGTDSATSGCTVCRLPVSHANATAHHALNSVASLGDKGGVCGQAQAISIACSFCVKRYANHALLFPAGDPGYGGIPSCQSNCLVDATGVHIACESGVTCECGVACWVSDAGAQIAAFHCCCGSTSSCCGVGSSTTRHGGCSMGAPWARCHNDGDESKESRNIGDRRKPIQVVLTLY